MRKCGRGNGADHTVCMIKRLTYNYDMNNTHDRRGGFIKLILLIVIALIVLGFFGYNLKDIIDSPTVHENLVYVWGLTVELWNTFIVAPAVWIWDKINGLL